MKTKSNIVIIITNIILKIIASKKKGRDVTQSYDKSPYTYRNVSIQNVDNISFLRYEDL